MSGDRRADLVGQVQAAAAFPVLFRDEDLDEVLEFATGVGLEPLPLGDVGLQVWPPILGERSVEDLSSLSFSPPLEHDVTTLEGVP
jgi:hypothetical protein